MRLPTPLRDFYFTLINVPSGHKRYALTYRHSKGVTVTQSWTTAALSDTKVEIVDPVAPGTKVEIQNLFNPSKPEALAQKINLGNPVCNSHS